MGQNIHIIFDDRFSRIESHLGMKCIGGDNNASTFNTNKAMDGLANYKSPTNNALGINSANQHNRINYNSAPHVNTPYGAASSLQHSTPPNFAQHLLSFLMPDRIDILQAHRITTVALHLGVFQGIVFFLREALWSSDNRTSLIVRLTRRG